VKYVFLPQLAEGPTRWEGETESAHRERVERERRQLFVGMTRARDGLWLGRRGELATQGRVKRLEKSAEVVSQGRVAHIDVGAQHSAGQ
jgi:superfamily I DNA/RNA helicase